MCLHLSSCVLTAAVRLHSFNTKISIRTYANMLLLPLIPQEEKRAMAAATAGRCGSGCRCGSCAACSASAAAAGSRPLSGRTPEGLAYRIGRLWGRRAETAQRAGPFIESTLLLSIYPGG